MIDHAAKHRHTLQYSTGVHCTHQKPRTDVLDRLINSKGDTGAEDQDVLSEVRPTRRIPSVVAALQKLGDVVRDAILH